MNKVLVVEDSDLNLKLFYDLLLIKKCEVITSRDGINAIDLAIKEQPNLVLMDIHLNSVVSGIDLIKALKSSPITKHIPIITITAFATKADQELIKKAGSDSYLPKPASIVSFFEAVNNFININ